MPCRPISFSSDETGAVTVDWVVLTAIIVGLGLAVTAVLGSGFRTQSTSLQRGLEREHTYSTFEEAEALRAQDDQPAEE